jgi:hypothetical protein
LSGGLHRYCAYLTGDAQKIKAFVQTIDGPKGEAGMSGSELIKKEEIQNRINTLRDVQVMMDEDLALLYGVETKVLNQTVKRNSERFPEEFMIQITDDEFNRLRSRIVTSNQRGGRRYLPYAFNEQGVAMLSDVLRSETTVKVSIRIMRDFVGGASLKDLGKKWFAFSKMDIGAVEMLTRLKEMKA